MKKFLILGGTGTLGKSLIKRILALPEDVSVTCFSRCELKQKGLRDEIKDPRLQFVLGDIRDRDFLFYVFSGMDTIFHVAALKHIDSMEENPEESVKTNIVGTINVADAAISCRVPYVVFSSTDKAVEPINVYGNSKAISEKILLRRNALQKFTQFSIYRWGNVVGSRGSAIPMFAKTLKDEGKAYLTDSKMTRFWIRIEEAIDFVMKSYRIPSNEVRIPDMKAASVVRVIEETAKIMGIDTFEILEIGKRRGEKIHEDLTSKFDTKRKHLNSGTAAHYTVEELHTIIRPIVEAAL